MQELFVAVFLKAFAMVENMSDLEKHFIEKLNAKKFFKNILKTLQSGRRFGVTVRIIKSKR